METGLEADARVGEGATMSGADMSGEPCCCGPAAVEPIDEPAHAAAISDAATTPTATSGVLKR